MRYSCFLGALWCACLAVYPSAKPLSAGEIRYRLTDLGDLPGGADQSHAIALNDAGQVVGVSATDIGLRAFLWHEGLLQDLGTLGGNYSYATGINAQGQVVGESNQTDVGDDRAFVWQDGSMRDLGTLGGTFASAAGINAAGDIVGQAETTANQIHAFLWRDGTMEDLATLGGDISIGQSLNNIGQVVGSSTATKSPSYTGFVWSDGSLAPLRELPNSGGDQIAESINDQGQIVGYTSSDAGYRAFLWESGIAHELAKLAGPHSFAYFIASDGHIVGTATPTADASIGHAVLWDPTGNLTDLNTRLDDSGEGWTLLDARHMNAAGQIVGGGETMDGITHGYLLTPYIVSPPTPGDTNADGVVDIKDLNNVRNQFGAVGSDLIGDTFPFNGVVGIEDLNAVRNNFGAAPLAIGVPEPNSLLLGLASLTVISTLCFDAHRTKQPEKVKP